jgi:hypothetical protein
MFKTKLMLVVIIIIIIIIIINKNTLGNENKKLISYRSVKMLKLLPTFQKGSKT